MKIQLMCRWPSAVHLFENPADEVDRLVQHAMEGLAGELQLLGPEDLDQCTIIRLESSVQKHVVPFLPLASQLDVSCCFVTHNLMVIDVTQKPSLHLNVSGVLH